MRKVKKSKSLVSGFTKYLPVLIILLSITIIVGSTFAYFTDKKDTSSNLTFSKVELSSETTVGIDGEIRDVIPGAKLVDGEVAFSKSIDSEAMYVRAKLSFSLPTEYADDADMIEFVNAIRSSTDFNIIETEQNGAVWSAKDGNYFYLVTKADTNMLKRVDTIDKYVLSNEIVFPRDLEQLEGNAQYMKSINFHIAFEAIQADNVSPELAGNKEVFNSLFPVLAGESIIEEDDEVIEEETATATEGLIFDGNKVIAYYGNEHNVVVPSSYSLSGETVDITRNLETSAELGNWASTLIQFEEFIHIPYPFVVTEANSTNITIASTSDLTTLNTGYESLNYPVSVTYTIPEVIEGNDYKVEEIASSALAGYEILNSSENVLPCDNFIQKLVLPEGLLTIGDTAIAYQLTLNSVNIPSTVTSIGAYAFTSLMMSNLYIPSSVDTIGQDAFNGSMITEIVNESGIEITSDTSGITDSKENSVTYVHKTNDGEIYFAVVSGTGLYEEPAFVVGASLDTNTLILPDSGVTIKGLYDETKTYTLTNYAIHMYSLAYNYTAEKIVISDAVTTIGEYSFAFICNLKEFEYNVTELENVIGFAYCGYLADGVDVTIGANVTTLPQGLFGDSDDLGETVMKVKNVNFEEGSQIKTISAALFGFNRYLETINIPDTVEVIELGAFMSCENLKEINLPSSLNEISDAAFMGCIKLTKVIIPSGVSKIALYAFSNCTALKYFEIPSTVTTISENGILKDCTALAYVVCESSEVATLVTTSGVDSTKVFIKQTSGYDALTFDSEVVIDSSLTVYTAVDAESYTWVRTGAEGAYSYYKCLAVNA